MWEMLKVPWYILVWLCILKIFTIYFILDFYFIFSLLSFCLMCHWLKNVLEKLCVGTCGIKALNPEWVMRDCVFAVIFTADPWEPWMTWWPTVRLYCTVLDWVERTGSISAVSTPVQQTTPNIWPAHTIICVFNSHQHMLGLYMLLLSLP